MKKKQHFVLGLLLAALMLLALTVQAWSEPGTAEAPLASLNSTALTCLQLLDQSSAGVAGGTARPAYGGSWCDGSVDKPCISGSTDAGGQLCTTLHPDLTKIEMTVNQSSQEQMKAELESSVYTWQTVPLVVELRDHLNNLITENPGGEVEQGGGFWGPQGYTGVVSPLGQVIVQIFGGKTFRFRMTYNKSSQVIDQAIPLGGGTITFQTGLLIINCDQPIQIALIGGWQTYPGGTELELLPGTYSFRGPCGSGSVTIEPGAVAPTAVRLTAFNGTTSVNYWPRLSLFMLCFGTLIVLIRRRQ